MNILHFPTGMPYREVGDTKIIARDDSMADFLAGIFKNIERHPEKNSSHDVTNFQDISLDDQQTANILDQLIRIERILRNDLPHNDKDVAGTIAHAHAEIELALEVIDAEGWQR